MNLQHFLEGIKKTSNYWELVCHYELPGNPPCFDAVRGYVSNRIFDILKSQGIHGLYRHQTDALKAIYSGRHVVVSTPTASGKSLIYNIGIAETLLEYRDARFLLIFPIKALSRDQYEGAKSFFRSVISSDDRIAIYDGDTPEKDRVKIRANIPNVLITNPDMLHYALLPYHQKWQELWENIKFIVIDEMHTYRGVFGSHVAMIVRRLKRVCNHYGSSPQFLLLSATIGNPRELAAQIIEVPLDDIVLVDQSTGPKPRRHVLFLKSDYPMSLVASLLAARAIKHGLKTIIFTRSRRMTELVFISLKNRYRELSGFISSYRAGLLPSDRREIERALNSGKLKCVVATSALELGVDIGDLDVCILVGYPGTIMNTWQRAGRVGRSGQESAIIMIPQHDALDQYVISHPEHVLSKNFETAVAGTENVEILKDHLVCAASEIPLTKDEVDSKPGWSEAVSELTESGKLWYGENQEFYASTRYPHRSVDIRQVGDSYTIFLKKKSAKAIPFGSVDGVRVFKECHPGAVYLHLGEMYQVVELDLRKRNVIVRPFDGAYFTVPVSEKHTDILEVISTRPAGNFVLRLGKLRVTERVLGYEKKTTRGMETLDYVELDLPSQSFETVGLWIEIDKWIEALVQNRHLHFMGGIHALEHAIISMFPLFLLCDRNDLGGIAHPSHYQIKKGAVFIYDSYPGGIGLCKEAFRIFEEILGRVQELLLACECENGCPLCIYSPKCGSGNKPLDKDAAKLISKALLDPGLLEKFGKVGTVENAPSFTPPKIMISKRKYRIAYLDLETQKLANEVGGWHNKHLMRVSVAVLYDEVKKDFLVFYESDLERLFNILPSYELIVGFNVKKFDYSVLSSYTTVDLVNLPTFDILEEIQRTIGFRVSLDSLAKATLGKNKIADGIQAVKWFRMQRWKELVEYCRADVDITRMLFRFAISNKYLLCTNKEGKKIRIPTPWDLDGIIKSVRDNKDFRVFSFSE